MIEVAGKDAAQVVNNLSTNDILKLQFDAHLETFITDVRGWVVAHAAAFKQADRVWLVGSHESPSKICNHIERYIIREQATIHDHSATHALLVLGDQADAAQAQLAVGQASNVSHGNIESESSASRLFSCRLPILGPTSELLCCQLEHLAQLEGEFRQQGAHLCSEELFQWLRISSFWPLSPADIGDKTIPQELDRDARAISFTKGCYLGQETIARLDARGQLQKKLCLLEFVIKDPHQTFQAGDKLMAGEKEAGLITSVARLDETDVWRTLALLRRGNFAPGTKLQCQGQTATVLEVDSK